MSEFAPVLPEGYKGDDPSVLNKIASLGERWRNDPVAFVREAIGAEPVAWQAEAMRALIADDKISIRSGHGVGKSSMLAWTVIWWLCTRAPAKVACTAPTAHQLQDVLWSEIGHWHGKMIQELKDLLDIRKEYIYVNGRAQDCFAVARTARQEQPEAFQGFHSPNMLFIVDEASAVPDIIFQVGQGAMSTKGAKAIMVGNPNRLSGFFYDSFHSNRALWKNFHVRCQDSPLASEKYIADMKLQYGEDHDVFRIRVLGDFPRGEANAVLELAKVEAAVGKKIDSPAAVIWGVDVARQGADRSTLAKRRGSALLEPVQWKNGFDNMEVAGWIMNEFLKTPDHEKPFAICIDVIGYGAGVYDRLKELGLPVKAINVANSAKDGKLYSRLRDELWFRAQEWFNGEVSMPDDPALISELVSVTYWYESNGKIKVEGKDDLKDRGLRSPDLADAFCLTFAYTSPINRLARKPFANQDYDIYG